MSNQIGGDVLLNRRSIPVNIPDEGKGDGLIRLSTSSYDGARSALVHLYTESGVEQNVNATTKHMWINFTSYKKGVTRIGVKECFWDAFHPYMATKTGEENGNMDGRYYHIGA